MDKQLVDNIKKVYSGILVYNIIGIVIIFIIKKASFSTIGGLIAGSLVAMLSFYMLARNIVSIVEKEKTKAVLASTFGYTARFVMSAAILIFAAVNKSINVYTVAFGLISTSVVIRIIHLLPRIFKERGKK